MARIFDEKYEIIEMKKRDYLPAFLMSSNLLGALMDAYQKEINRLNKVFEEVEKSIYLEDNLQLWEFILGIQSDELKTDKEKVSSIQSKLRSAGNATTDFIKAIADAFENGEVEVEVLSSEHKFKIHFISKIGMVPNIALLTQTIELIKPAHLAFEYVYYYNTHSTISKFTHSKLGGYTYNQLRNEVLI